ncbi:hypothetical protein DACRYDRAFT_103972 [Dacryopinax primogenitus]|uniref:Uncharacterized protein n=1 Tax=Dacryopinax primogenitus (strain DJM 731) TaxID=1858805 RepID=M5G5F7_DACPD|nr:uncharacterized protein DACRYDRAFT_103972 [Dacryopinax primogenitus]EJU05486.1 hypothetical protein DACRYDRAFT_103972 [Dacryopinax primogenitus]
MSKVLCNCGCGQMVAGSTQHLHMKHNKEEELQKIVSQQEEHLKQEECQQHVQSFLMCFHKKKKPSLDLQMEVEVEETGPKLEEVKIEVPQVLEDGPPLLEPQDVDWEMAEVGEGEDVVVEEGEEGEKGKDVEDVVMEDEEDEDEDEEEELELENFSNKFRLKWQMIPGEY